MQASIDRQGRLALVPSNYEPEELFLHRPKGNRCLSLEQLEQIIAAALLATLRQLRDGQRSLAFTCVSARTNKAVQRLEGWPKTKFQLSPLGPTEEECGTAGSIPIPQISRRQRPPVGQPGVHSAGRSDQRWNRPWRADSGCSPAGGRPRGRRGGPAATSEL